MTRTHLTRTDLAEADLSRADLLLDVLGAHRPGGCDVPGDCRCRRCVHGWTSFVGVANSVAPEELPVDVVRS
nr:hypothetical protein [Rhodococcus tukisamuensis]